MPAASWPGGGSGDFTTGTVEEFLEADPPTLAATPFLTLHTTALARRDYSGRRRGHSPLL